MDVARKLIEHDDAREAAAWLFQPVPALSRPHLLVQGAEALGNFGVEGVVLLEPALVPLAVLGAFPEPEVQHLKC